VTIATRFAVAPSFMEHPLRRLSRQRKAQSDGDVHADGAARCHIKPAQT
jgi:hypothetical protein